MKIPLKIKVFAWYLRRGVILTKDNLANATGMEVKSAYSVTKSRLLNTCSSSVSLLGLYGQLSK
jgi:hypothetical protein